MHVFRKVLQQTAIKKYSRKTKKGVTNSGTFMGQSLLEVRNVIKAYYHISKEFAQVFLTTFFCTMWRKSHSRSWTKKINKYPNSTRTRTMTIGHTVFVVNLMLKCFSENKIVISRYSATFAIFYFYKSIYFFILILSK